MNTEQINIRDAVDGAPGYWAGPGLTEIEIVELRRLIEQRFLARIATIAPDDVDHFAAAGLAQYHLESYRIDHSSVWPRHERLMGQDGIDFINQSSLMYRLAAEFGSAQITNEIEGEPPEVVWRLVRPGQTDDVGPLHADRWFWDINKWPTPDGQRCIKVWLLVNGDTGLAGLRVAPGTHRQQDWNYTVEYRHGLDKPVFDEAVVDVEPFLLETPPGSAVVFSYDLLHGGAVTMGDQCRVSLEFTLFVPQC